MLLVSQNVLDCLGIAGVDPYHGNSLLEDFQLVAHVQLQQQQFWDFVKPSPPHNALLVVVACNFQVERWSQAHVLVLQDNLKRKRFKSHIKHQPILDSEAESILAKKLIIIDFYSLIRNNKSIP